MSGDGLIPIRPPKDPVDPDRRRRQSITVTVTAAVIAALVIITVGVPVSVGMASAVLGPGPSEQAPAAEPTLSRPTAEDAATIEVPSVVGMTRADARAVLQNRGFAVIDAGVPAGNDDRVVKQQPEASTIVEEGAIVALAFAAPTPTPTPTPSVAPAPAPPPPDTLQYSVWGNGSSASSVTYSIPNGAFSQSQVADAPIPWSVTLPITGRFNSLVMLAQAGDGNSISCAISVNGKIVDQQTSTGPYTIVTCSHVSY